MAQAREIMDFEIDGLLRTRGSQWTSGTGYVQLWQLAHRVEEILLTAETDEGVAVRGVYEERRLDGAQISEVNELLAQIRHAVVTLDPTASFYLKQMPPSGRPASSRNASTANGGGLASERASVEHEEEYEDDDGPGSPAPIPG